MSFPVRRRQHCLRLFSLKDSTVICIICIFIQKILASASRTKFLTICRLHGMKRQTYQNPQYESIAPGTVDHPPTPASGGDNILRRYKNKDVRF
jgi:hypothetical protein